MGRGRGSRIWTGILRLLITRLTWQRSRCILLARSIRLLRELIRWVSSSRSTNGGSLVVCHIGIRPTTGDRGDLGLAAVSVRGAEGEIGGRGHPDFAVTLASCENGEDEDEDDPELDEEPAEP
jgi:hypothetical protein